MNPSSRIRNRQVCFIYALIEPARRGLLRELEADPDKPFEFAHRVRYVGKTEDIERRFQEHLDDARKNRQDPKAQWIAALLRDGQVPVFVVLEQCWTEESDQRERGWELEFRRYKANLTNQRECGGGPIYAKFRRPVSDERRQLWIARSSERLKERWQDPEYRAAISAMLKERWQDPEYRARQLKHLDAINSSPRESKEAKSERQRRIWAERKASGWGFSETAKANRKRSFQERTYCLKSYGGFIDPHGHAVAPIIGMKVFCHEHGLVWSHMVAVYNGRRPSHMGYTCPNPS